VKPINYTDSYLVIEFTNRCPLRCTHCIQSLFDKYEHFVQFGYLDPQILHGLLEDLATSGIRFQNLITFWIGEPVLHPKFAQMYLDILEFNARYNIFDQIEVNTSGVPLTKATTDLILAGGKYGHLKQKWHFTIDATTAETYRLIKGKDEFDRASANIQTFLEARTALGVQFPRVVYQFIVRDGNHHEAEAYRDYWLRRSAELGRECSVVAGGVEFIDNRDSIFYRLYDAVDFDNQEASNQLYQRTTARLGIDMVGPHRTAEQVAKPMSDIPVCSGMWKSPTINWDGRVTVCTRDSSLELGVGDLRHQKFSEMWWNNSRLDAMRMGQATRRYHDISLCEGCIIPRSANYTGITGGELDDWQRKLTFAGYRRAVSG